MASSATKANAMSWMITDQSQLSGTCYIEVLPGKYENQCWNPESVYFEEEHFGFIEPTIVRHCPEHDHYAFTNISRLKWQAIVADLERFANMIGDETRPSNIEGQVGLFFATTKQSFLRSDEENMAELRAMLIEFISWIRKMLDSHDTIAVLGM